MNGYFCATDVIGKAMKIPTPLQDRQQQKAQETKPVNFLVKGNL